MRMIVALSIVSIFGATASAQFIRGGGCPGGVCRPQSQQYYPAPQYFPVPQVQAQTMPAKPTEKAKEGFEWKQVGTSYDNGWTWSWAWEQREIPKALPMPQVMPAMEAVAAQCGMAAAVSNAPAYYDAAPQGWGPPHIVQVAGWWPGKYLGRR